MADRIQITDLSLRCIIGVNAEERRERQDVIVQVSLSVDLARAGRSDRLEDSVDYRALKKRIVSLVEASHYHLIEALAVAIAGVCLEDPMVIEATVRVDKPGALRFARSVAVEITRRGEP